MGEGKLEGLDKTRVIDLWVAQLNLERIKEQLEEEKGKVKELVKSMTDDELTILMETFHNRLIESEIPDCIVYAIHELAEREDKEFDQEDFPF